MDKCSSIFCLAVIDEERTFSNIDFRCQCYKTFFPSSLTVRPRGVAFGNPFQFGLRIWGQGQSQPNWSTFQMLPSWVSSANVWLDWKVIARYKISCLFGLAIIDEEKTFSNLDFRSMLGPSATATAADLPYSKFYPSYQVNPLYRSWTHHFNFFVTYK